MRVSYILPDWLGKVLDNTGDADLSNENSQLDSDWTSSDFLVLSMLNHLL